MKKLLFLLLHISSMVIIPSKVLATKLFKQVTVQTTERNN